MSVQIHIVMGTTGEYSDRSEWPVAAYFNEKAAVDHADLAKLEAHRIEKEGYDEVTGERKSKNPYDAKMRMDYTGTDYYTISVDLLDAIPGIDG